MNRKLIYRTSLGAAILLFGLLFVGKKVFAEGKCSRALEAQWVPQTSSYFIKRVEEIDSESRHPKWIDIRTEKKRSRSWQGTQLLPSLIKQALTNDMALIDFQLIGAEPGTVKTASPGNFVQVRLRHTWRDYRMSTNLGLPINSLINRIVRSNVDPVSGFSTEKKILHPEDAKAVILFLHGGGTKTTGHHVAAALSNFMAQYEVAVVSIDAPAHAFGPPVLFRNPLLEAQYLVEFRNTFLPKDMPVFVGGHSRGGAVVDMLMRLSDRPELGIREAFTAGISLSTPIDPKPGGTLAEKEAAEAEISKDPRLRSEVPAEEVDLNIQLLKQGKIASVSSIASGLYMNYFDWVKPEHKGKDYLPVHYQMGRYDGLYIARENIFKEYVQDLENTDVLVMDERQSFKGGTKKIAHMIFDHYRPGTNQFESFQSQVEYIEKILGTKLERKVREPGSDTYGLVTLFVRDYLVNLAFRVFAEEFSMVRQRASDQIAELGHRTQRVLKKLKRLSRIKKPTLAEQARHLNLQKKLQPLQARQQLREVPPGENAEFAKANLAQRDWLVEELKRLQAKKKVIGNELNGEKNREQGLASKNAKKEKKLASLVERALDHFLDQVGGGEKVPQSIVQLDQVISELILVMEKQDTLSAKVMREQRGTPGKEIELGDELIGVHEEFSAKVKEFMQAQDKARQDLFRLALKGDFAERFINRKEIKSLYIDLYGRIGKPDAPAPGSAASRLEQLEKEIIEVDSQITQRTFERDELTMSYVNTITPGLYTFDRTTFAKELDKDLDELLADHKGVQKLWRIWLEIWRDRPVVKDNSLY